MAVGNPNMQGDVAISFLFFSSLLPVPQTPGNLVVLVPAPSYRAWGGGAGVKTLRAEISPAISRAMIPREGANFPCPFLSSSLHCLAHTRSNVQDTIQNYSAHRTQENLNLHVKRQPTNTKADIATQRCQMIQRDVCYADRIWKTVRNFQFTTTLAGICFLPWDSCPFLPQV